MQSSDGSPIHQTLYGFRTYCWAEYIYQVSVTLLKIKFCRVNIKWHNEEQTREKKGMRIASTINKATKHCCTEDVVRWLQAEWKTESCVHWVAHGMLLRISNSYLIILLRFIQRDTNKMLPWCCLLTFSTLIGEHWLTLFRLYIKCMMRQRCGKWNTLDESVFWSFRQRHTQSNVD